MSLFNKRLFYRIGLYTTAAVIAFSLYARANIPPETDEEYCKRKGMVKIHNKFYKYDVYEHNEMKPIVDMLTKGCADKSYCEIDRAYRYVLNIPYKSSTLNRTPSDVINENGGDCDEKSFLLATLLIQNHYECLLITTKDHGFIAVHLPDETQLRQPASYLSANGKKYYFAETTQPDSYIGKYNGIDLQAVEGIFDMNAKKEIEKKEVTFSVLPVH